MAAQETGGGPPPPGTVVGVPVLGTDWTTAGTTGLSLTRFGDVVLLSFQLKAGAASSFDTLMTLPVGFRPAVATAFIGYVRDDSISTLYLCTVYVGTTGQITVGLYDNGTALVSAFACGVNDLVQGAAVFIA